MCSIGTGAAYLLNYRIITDDGPILASTVTYLLPVVAVVLGWIVLDEVLTGRVVVGVAVVLIGVTPPGDQSSGSTSSRLVAWAAMAERSSVVDTLLRTQRERPLGDVQLRSTLTEFEVAQASDDAADNLLAKALRDRAAGNHSRA